MNEAGPPPHEKAQFPRLRVESYKVINHTCEVKLDGDVPISIKVNGKEYYRGDRVIFQRVQMGEDTGFIININTAGLKRGDPEVITVIDAKGEPQALRPWELKVNIEPGRNSPDVVIKKEHARILDASRP